MKSNTFYLTYITIPYAVLPDVPYFHFASTKKWNIYIDTEITDKLSFKDGSFGNFPST